ncbi:DUF5666 domain-containing protein [Thermus filiformis]|uniref:DUF5666 domain-containing protein n=1 Tax=Thermus filiformis TaxID=276 RepID=UPI00126A3CB9|nr:DUF5666 domain-containing protein [Thermus filiformis]
MRWTLLLVGLLLAACQTAQPPQAGSGVAVLGVLGGTPDRPTLAGKPLDLSGATVTKDGEAWTGDLLPGMVVRAEGQEGASSLKVERLEVQVKLKGPVEAVDVNAGTLTVLGQTVFTDAGTQIYEKAGGAYRTLLLTDLSPGDFVEVQGTSAQGGLLATYIERYPTGGEVRLEGAVQNLDPAGKTFQLSGYTVDYSRARVEGTPQEGAWAEVRGTLSGTTLQASRVSFKTAGGSGFGASRRVELEGPISDLNEAQKTFRLLGYTVDYAQAVVVGQLAEGVYVEAKGQVDAQDPGLFHAQQVKVKYPRTRAPKAEAKGQVTAVDPDRLTLDLGSLGFYADANTLLKRDDPDGPIAFAEIQVGDFVEVRYDPALTQEGRFYALKVEVKGRSGGQGGIQEWKGTVSQVDRTAYTFVLLGNTVATTPSTRFEWHDQPYDQAGFFALLQEGDVVEVKGSNSGGVVQASKVELKRR